VLIKSFFVLEFIVIILYFIVHSLFVCTSELDFLVYLTQTLDAPSLAMLEEWLEDNNTNLDYMMAMPESRKQWNDGAESGASNLIINYLPLDIDSIDLKVSISHIF